LGDDLETGEYLTVASASSVDDLGPMTFSAWVKWGGDVGSTFWNKGTDDGLQVRNTTALGFSYATDATVVRRETAASFLTSGTWMYLTYTWTGTSSGSGIHIFRDAVEETSYAVSQGSGTVASDATNTLAFGARTTNEKYAISVMDEIRISNVIRSDDWITLNYQNQKSTDALTSIADTITGNYTVYVDKATGNDGNTCSQARNPGTPKLTVESADDCVPTSDTFGGPVIVYAAAQNGYLVIPRVN